MKVTLEPEVAEELILFKLQHLQETIGSILDKWNQDNIEDFVNKARSGELLEAEMDAITIRQLEKDRERLQNLLDIVISREGE